jgi:hypothetical protein
VSNQVASVQAEQQLILLSAATAARREETHDQALSLIAEVDWRRLAATLRTRKLLPTLGPRILDLAEGSADGGFLVDVEDALEAGRRQGAFLQLVSMRLTRVLADAGIRSTALKGPLLSEALFGDPGRRLSSDVDLLVAPGELQSAVEVVRSMGYGTPADYVQDSGLPLLHFVLPHERGELPPVELHWRVHWYERSFAHERLLPAVLDPPAGWRPAAVDELAALLLFYARDGFIDLRMASDIGAWWDVRGGSLQPGELDRLIEAYPQLARVIGVAVVVAANVVGLPAARIIGKSPDLGLRERTAARLANPNPSSSSSVAQLYAEMGLIDGLLAPSGGFRAFVRRQVLPPSEVLDQQARHGARRRARSPLGRGAGVLARYGMAITRLARSPKPVSLDR